MNGTWKDIEKLEKDLWEAGDVDVMISIRGNFFYTRTVPCELWFFDRGKPAERKDKVLMLDARGVFRKVTRKIYDFSPEQMKNLAAIVWLHRGQTDRYLRLIDDYFWSLGQECALVAPIIGRDEAALDQVRERVETVVGSTNNRADDEAAATLRASVKELAEALAAYASC
jgi:type I restriction enzyme M protein